MKGRVLVLLASVLVLASVIVYKSFLSNETVDKFMTISELEYRTDFVPVNKRFPLLKNARAVYWKAGYVNRPSIGPTDVWFKGFVVLDEGTYNNIITNYVLDTYNLEFQEGMTPEITGFSEFKWTINKDFSKELLGNEYVGEVYIDTINKLIFFDLSTY